MAGGVNAIGNLQGKVDANNQLVVALGSGSTLPSDTDIDAGTGTADAGIGGVLTVSTTSAQTGANTNETDLWTYSLPANTLSTDGYAVRITTVVQAAANGNGKTMKLYFGATAIATRAGGDNGTSGVFAFTVFRTGAATQLSVGAISGHASSSAIGVIASPTETLSGAVVIKVTGQNGSANAGDIVFRSAVVEFIRAGS